MGVAAYCYVVVVECRLFFS